MQVTSILTSNFTSLGGTGGFLHPEKIAMEFGIQPGMSAADFGCGAGYFTILLGQMIGPNGKVYAVDIQETALDNVRVRAKAANLENIEIVRSNLEVLGSSGLPDDSQDFVLLANILFQSDKKSEIIKEAKRVLKPGGRLVLIDWRPGTGGFGPPDSRRTDENMMQSMAVAEGLTFEKGIDSGQFHYGLSFIKN